MASISSDVERLRRLLGLGMIALAGLIVAAVAIIVWANTDPAKPTPNDGGGGVGDALRPTEAEVACERGVRNATGERPRFDHQQTTAITGGYKVYGVATWDAQAVGYICTVTCPSGRHSVTVELNP